MAAQLEQTQALLNKYANMLSKSEDFARLIFDERWQGGEAVSIPCIPRYADAYVATRAGRRSFTE